MTIMTDLNRLAQLAFDNYYYSDITDENTLHEYIQAGTDRCDDDKPLHARLVLALGDDIHDLLHNGNDEDLGWSEDDTDDFREDDYYDNLGRLSSLIAAKIISRIFPPATQTTQGS